MCFSVTTENPNVMMRENHNTQSCEYIIICQDELHIVPTTSEEILHVFNDKYKINTYCYRARFSYVFPHIRKVAR